LEKRSPLILEWLRKACGFFPHDVKAMVMKDIRTFFRDPVQWSQALIFFGLLAIYFANLRSFNYHIQMDHWRNMMGFLNVFSVSAVMCSLGSRFVYPQLSMEGQGFWVLGLSPTSMKRILITKFLMSVTGMLAIGLLLVILSSNMLKVDPDARSVAIRLVAAVSVAVCSLSTGLGAIFLDLRQRNPSAIVSGFGGTLNLVACLGFMLATIVPFSVIYHMEVVLKLGSSQLQRALFMANVWLAVILAGTVVLPLWLGLRSLRNRDY
jgi:ABC-2 type transport system permease protein